MDVQINLSKNILLYLRWSLQQLLPLLGNGVQLELQQVLGGGEQLLVTLRLHLLGERGQLQQVSLQQRTHRIDVNCL